MKKSKFLIAITVCSFLILVSAVLILSKLYFGVKNNYRLKEGEARRLDVMEGIEMSITKALLPDNKGHKLSFLISLEGGKCHQYIELKMSDSNYYDQISYMDQNGIIYTDSDMDGFSDILIDSNAGNVISRIIP